jgi:hypothetical protein
MITIHNITRARPWGIKLGIKYFELHLVMKYYSGLHRYIQIDMDFVYISSLGVTYRYVVKIEQNLKKNNKWDFGSENPS